MGHGSELLDGGLGDTSAGESNDALIGGTSAGQGNTIAFNGGAGITQVQNGDHNSILELRVAPGDIGKVIGKDGRTAQSIRTILVAASTKLGRRAQLDILD